MVTLGGGEMERVGHKRDPLWRGVCCAGRGRIINPHPVRAPLLSSTLTAASESALAARSPSQILRPLSNIIRLLSVNRAFVIFVERDCGRAKRSSDKSSEFRPVGAYPHCDHHRPGGQPSCYINRSRNRCLLLSLAWPAFPCSQEIVPMREFPNLFPLRRNYAKPLARTRVDRSGLIVAFGRRSCG